MLHAAVCLKSSMQQSTVPKSGFIAAKRCSRVFEAYFREIYSYDKSEVQLLWHVANITSQVCVHFNFGVIIINIIIIIL